MAVALTSTPSEFIRAICSALSGGGWQQVLGAQSLREADVASGAPGALSFRVQGEISVSEDTTRQGGSVDSVRLAWKLPIEVRVMLDTGDAVPAAVAVDVIVDALRLLNTAPNVKRTCKRLTLVTGSAGIYGTGDRTHAYITLSLGADVTHDMHPGRTPTNPI